jgi:hypothetical protein
MMEELTAVVLHKKFGNILVSDARVDIPWGWHMIVDKMLGRLAELPTNIRCYLIVNGIRIDDDGLLMTRMVALPDHMPQGGFETVQQIVADARNEAAWTCVSHSGEAGWIVRVRTGHPRPLCPACQDRNHIKPQVTPC